MPRSESLWMRIMENTNDFGLAPAFGYPRASSCNKNIINIRMYQYPLKRSVFRTRPKVKPKENSWKRTAYRRSAKLGRIHYLDITISIPLGLQPVATIHCGRYATPSRLIFYEAIRFLPSYPNLTAWKNITFFLSLIPQNLWRKDPLSHVPLAFGSLSSVLSDRKIS